MSDEQGERETCPNCGRPRAECEQHWPLSEYNAETLATMLDQARAGNAKLQGELERVRPVVAAVGALSDVYDPGRNSPVPFAAARTLAERELLRRYDVYLSTHPAPSAPAERSAPGGTAGVECSECTEDVRCGAHQRQCEALSPVTGKRCEFMDTHRVNYHSAYPVRWPGQGTGRADAGKP